MLKLNRSVDESVTSSYNTSTDRRKISNAEYERSLGIQEYLYELSHLASGVNIYSCIHYKQRLKANDGREKSVNLLVKKDESTFYMKLLCV